MTVAFFMSAIIALYDCLCQAVPYSFSSVSTSLGNGKYQYYSYYENNTVHSFDVIASADAAYSFGDVQVYGGVDIGISLASSFSKRVETNGIVTNSGDILSGFAMSVTPRFGVSYAF